jgi:hypothetical protein
MNKSTETVYKQLRSTFHADKLEPQHNEEGNKLFAELTKAYEAGNEEAILAMFKAWKAGKYFAAPIVEQVRELHADGHTKAQANAYAKFKGWEKEAAQAAIDEVYGKGREGSASKADVVRYIRAMETAAVSRKQMATNLCARFEWSLSTANTVLAHLEYMREYARQYTA